MMPMTDSCCSCMRLLGCPRRCQQRWPQRRRWWQGWRPVTRPAGRCSQVGQVACWHSNMQFMQHRRTRAMSWACTHTNSRACCIHRRYQGLHWCWPAGHDRFQLGVCPGLAPIPGHVFALQGFFCLTALTSATPWPTPQAASTAPATQGSAASATAAEGCSRRWSPARSAAAACQSGPTADTATTEHPSQQWR